MADKKITLCPTWTRCKAECHAVQAACNAAESVTSLSRSNINYEGVFLMKTAEANYNDDMHKILENMFDFEPEIITLGEMSKEDLFLLQKTPSQKVHAIITTTHVSDESRFYSRIFSLLRNINESNCQSNSG